MSTQPGTVFIPGSVPVSLISRVVANDDDIPAEMHARIVDPRDFEAVPIIDLSADESVVLEQLRYACEARRGFPAQLFEVVPADFRGQHCFNPSLGYPFAQARLHSLLCA